MNAVARAAWNPIVAKEYRSRMRTWRSPLAITVYIVLLGGLGWAVFAAMASTASGFNTGYVPNYGQQLFTFLILFQVALLAFITPALTAGAISGERERQTLDLLFVTPIPPFSIIWGKLLASMSFVVLLLATSVPIFSLVFLFGGIELDQVLEAFAVTGTTALMLGVVGIAFSTLFRRTLAATVAAYGAGFVLLAGTLLFGLLFPTDADPASATTPAPPVVTLISPALPLYTIASNGPLSTYGVRYPNGPNYLNKGGCVPQSNGGVACYGSASSGPAVFNGYTTSSGSTNTSPTALSTGLFQGWQYWQAGAVMQLMITAVALAFAAFILPPVRRLRLRRSKPA
jgi:ABC-type transport system involved in multi-copper enzyme maturation permease subunit